jgi:hypothetical protein
MAADGATAPGAVAGDRLCRHVGAARVVIGAMVSVTSLLRCR